MSNAVWRITDLLSMLVFSFGATAFVILALSYWRTSPARTAPFRLFSIACAGAFLANLASALYLFDGRPLVLLQAICTGALPALMLHVTMDAVGTSGKPWRALLVLSYAASLGSTLVVGLQPDAPLDTSARAVFAVVVALALVRVGMRRTGGSAGERQERRWMIGIFVALLGCSLAELVTDYPALTIVPDYLVLLFFAVRLYYAERLAFFDVFLKGGAYFAVGLIVLTGAAMAGLTAAAPFSRWDRVWIVALLLMPAWLAAPMLHRRLSTWIDRRILHRRYSPALAETTLTAALQGAETLEQLTSRAEQALGAIFDCAVLVQPNASPLTSRPGDLVAGIVPGGVVHLRARPAQPFLSEEQRLLERLSVTLGNAWHSMQIQQLRQEQHLREEELRALTARAELRALRAQINPHFLFNALNAVAGCIRTRPDVADETLARLAEIFRYTLTRSDKEWVRLSEEVDFVEAYLAVEQARFRDRLRVRIQVDPLAASVLVPTMILQPVVENAVKHGTSRLTQSGEIAVDVSVAAGYLTIEVSDNGPGFPPTIAQDGLAGGHGLRNVADRLQRYYGGAGSLRWHNGPERTVVTIAIPMEAARSCAS